MEKSIEDLGSLIKQTREDKGLSCRELARQANMDNTEISRIEKGLRKKPNVLFLKGIAEALDLSLVKLMKLAGYSDFDINWGRNRDENRSSTDLLEQISRYEKAELDFLGDAQEKRDNVRKQRAKLFKLIDRYRNAEYTKNTLTLEETIIVVEEVFDELLASAEKYDYSKLAQKRD